MDKRIIGYRIEVEVLPGDNPLSNITPERITAKAKEMAEEFVSQAERHIDHVNRTRYPGSASWYDRYETYVKPIYEDDKGA